MLGFILVNQKLDPSYSNINDDGRLNRPLGNMLKFRTKQTLTNFQNPINPMGLLDRLNIH